MPDDATDVSRFTGDPDGDGAADELTTYQVFGRWHLRAALASGDTIDTAIAAAGTTMVGRPFVGAHDIDRDGDDELLTRAGSGAAAELVALWDLEGCTLAAVTLNGEPAVFPIGTSVAAVTGLSCSDSHVDHLYFTDLTSQDGELYEGTVTGLDLVAGRLVGQGVEDAAVPSETLGAVAGLHCGSLALA